MDNSSLKICVCGAGTMGTGITQVFASKGFSVVLYDLDENILNVAREKMNQTFQILTDKNKITVSQKNEALQRIQFTNELKDCIAGLIIEAVVENATIKAELLNKLSEINSASTVFATNTSSLSVTSIAEKFVRPEKLAGMHFFNPAPLMKLVEVIKTSYSSEETINLLTTITKQIGKSPVICNDSPGFIVNRVARPYYLEALFIHEQTGIPIETIDKLMESCRFRMGPFKLMDLIGNDINYSVSTIVHEALGSPARLKPSLIQKEMVIAGSLGRKTGKGYYDYPA